MPAKKEISFLPESEDVNSLPSRIVRWLTTVGRFIIVFTELIVICAFLSRFWLDRTNSDLSEVLRQQKAILASTADFEKEYTLLQKRLKLVKTFYQQQPQYQDKIDTLVQNTPPDIVYRTLSLRRTDKAITASISLTTFSEASIIDFITKLMSTPKIYTVDIKNIEKKPRDAKYTIDLDLTFSSTS